MHEYAGQIDERLDLPAAWEINVMRKRGHDAPVLTPDQIRRQLARPIGTRPFRELAAGQRTVVITSDDLTRASPLYAVTPWVAGELEAAGISEEHVLFLRSFGMLRAMT